MSVNEEPSGINTSVLPLHMYIRPLVMEDLDAITELETKCFPPNERANSETIGYRLKTCPELCSGLFIREFDSISKELLNETLIGHILSTKISTNYITLASMGLKNHESGNTIAIHSLVIEPSHQKKNLATLLLTDFIQKLSHQEVGNKIVIIAHEPLIPFYERVGFKVVGENQDVVKNQEFAKSKWFDMERELIKEDYDN